MKQRAAFTVTHCAPTFLSIAALGLWMFLLLGNTRAAKPEELITCELTGPPKSQDVSLIGGQAAYDKAKGTYHYKLWLPPAYQQDETSRWPCLFIASPGGNAGMGPMAAWVKANDCIAVMLVESKNGPWPPIIGNFLAAHDDVVKRVRIQEGLKFATGFSGGARASSCFVQYRPGFAGLIMQGAGAASDDRGSYQTSSIKSQPSLFCAIIIGDKDSNGSEGPRMRAALGTDKLLLLSFAGGHQWAPAEKFEESMNWIESRLLKSPTATPGIRALCLRRATRDLASLPPATESWARYQKITAVLTFVQQGNLQTDPTLAARLPGLIAERKELATNPSVKPELAAAQALASAEQMRARSSPAMFVMNCNNIVKLYPGTEAAARAARFATEAK